MKSIGILIPYFGKWPEWIELFFDSVERNKTIDFHFLTDCDTTFRDCQDWAFRLTETDITEEALFETTTIQQIIKEGSFEEIDFLKIDIEGGEVEVFKNFKQLEWLNSVKIIALEIHDEFNCREYIEENLGELFELRHLGELTIGIHKKLNL